MRRRLHDGLGASQGPRRFIFAVGMWMSIKKVDLLVCLLICTEFLPRIVNDQKCVLNKILST